MPEWYAPTAPENVKPYPWLSGHAVNYMESILQPDFEVIEHGSGGSTLWFAKRVRHVVAFENNPKWFEWVNWHAPSNVNLLLAAPKSLSSEKSFDLLLIDGDPVETRAWWLEFASQLVRPGGYLVLDNANRPEYAEAREKMRSVFTHLKTVDSNKGGTIHLVTEFYQL